jgi:hypothetical protein
MVTWFSIREFAAPSALGLQQVSDAVSNVEGENRMEPEIAALNSQDKLVPPAAVTADFAPPGEVVPTEDDFPQADKYLRESVLAEELYARALQERDKGSREETVSHLLKAAKHAEMAHEWHLAALSMHMAGDLFRANGPTRDLPRAMRMYRRAIAAYEQCGHFDESNTLDYQVCNLRLWSGRELGSSRRIRLEMFFYWLTAGFGYRPLRVLMTGMVLILAFALIYWATGGVITADEDPVSDFNSAAYFSGTTFLTINYGDLFPARHVRWLTVLEGLTGLTTISFFVVILANRLRH